MADNMKHSYCYHSNVDYFPIRAGPNVFYFPNTRRFFFLMNDVLYSLIPVVTFNVVEYPHLDVYQTVVHSVIQETPCKNAKEMSPY